MLFEVIQIHCHPCDLQKSGTEIKMQHQINCLQITREYNATDIFHYHIQWLQRNCFVSTIFMSCVQNLIYVYSLSFCVILMFLFFIYHSQHNEYKMSTKMHKKHKYITFTYSKNPKDTYGYKWITILGPDLQNLFQDHLMLRFILQYPKTIHDITVLKYRSSKSAWTYLTYIFYMVNK